MGRKIISIVVVAFIVFGWPNLFNRRERYLFSAGYRLALADRFRGRDSVTIVPGEYYQSSTFHNFFFGQKNRRLWLQPVTVPVLQLDTAMGRLTAYERGGSQQTISVRLRDTAGRDWVLRSVNKDQQNALPGFLKWSALRPVFRDQVAAMNPYAPMVVASLAESLGLPHLQPHLFWCNRDAGLGNFQNEIAGRLVYLEEQPDSSWTNDQRWGRVSQVMNTEEMFAYGEHHEVPVDTVTYLRTRLLDMLVCDWDRHERQWRWLLTNLNGKMMIRPLAKDHDMAMYQFDDGLLSYVALAFNPKFQSFNPTFEGVWGLMKQAKNIDRKILKGLGREKFLAAVAFIRNRLTAVELERAVRHYPPEVYRIAGTKHRQVLASRLQELGKVAAKFYQLVND